MIFFSRLPAREAEGIPIRRIHPRPGLPPGSKAIPLRFPLRYDDKKFFPIRKEAVMLELLKHRRSIRTFTDEPVSQENIDLFNRL